MCCDQQEKKQPPVFTVPEPAKKLTKKEKQAQQARRQKVRVAEGAHSAHFHGETCGDSWSHNLSIVDSRNQSEQNH